MKSAGDLVGIVIKLAAGVQDGEYHSRVDSCASGVLIKGIHGRCPQP